MPGAFPELEELHVSCGSLRAATKPGSAGVVGELALLRLKGKSRAVLHHIEQTKVTTGSERASYDANSLQLHNLLYEKNHYQRQIAKCEDFRSKHVDIELVPEQVFLEAAPPDLRRMGEEVGAHQRMLDRLEFELHERQRLAEEKLGLATRKSELGTITEDKAEFVRSLPGQLRNMQKASLPLQKSLNIEATSMRLQHEVAQSLPSPLYVVYAHLGAFRQTGAVAGVTVEIQGEAADAEGWYRRRREAAALPSDETADGAAAAKEEEEEEEEGGHRSKRAKTESSDPVASNSSSAMEEGGGVDLVARGGGTGLGDTGEDGAHDDEQAAEEESAGAAATVKVSQDETFPLTVRIELPVELGMVALTFS
jgi:THO complex subunit 5